MYPREFKHRQLYVFNRYGNIELSSVSGEWLIENSHQELPEGVFFIFLAVPKKKMTLDYLFDNCLGYVVLGQIVPDFDAWDAYLLYEQVFS